MQNSDVCCSRYSPQNDTESFDTDFIYSNKTFLKNLKLPLKVLSWCKIPNQQPVLGWSNGKSFKKFKEKLFLILCKCSWFYTQFMVDL